MHRGFKLKFLSDATGTLDLDNSVGQVTAEELRRAFLCAPQMLLSEVIDTESWLERL